MKIIYSYKGNKPDDFLLKMAELSGLSVKHHSNYTTELWVEEKNVKYFPTELYDNVVVTDFGGIKSNYWNLSKMFVYSQQEEPFVHMDFDTCIMPGFVIPDNDIVCEKMRMLYNKNLPVDNPNIPEDFRPFISNVDPKRYGRHLLNPTAPEHIICSGLLGGVNYGDIFKEHYDWAVKQIIDKPTYEDMISLEEVAFTQRVQEQGLHISATPQYTLIHFWVPRGVDKQKTHGEWINSLLNFHKNFIK